MRLARFDDNRLGLVDGDCLRDVSAALDVLPAVRYPIPPGDMLIARLDAVLARARDIAPSSPRLSLNDVVLRSPVANPGKVVAAPVNYQKHLDEVRDDPSLHQGNVAHTAAINQIGLFLKSPTSLVGPGEGIALRKLDRRNDHEVELAFVIGKTASQVPAKDAMDYVAG